MMPYFRSQAAPPRLPEGFSLAMEDLPVDAEAVNLFLQRCGAPVRSDSKVALALERSAWSVRVLRQQELVGFVRITSDQALNANLWDLQVLPGEPEADAVLAVLIHISLNRLKRDLPGCSVSLAATPMAVPVLERFGFIGDPNGIRAMGLTL